jgi:hypothetical protein
MKNETNGRHRFCFIASAETAFLFCAVLLFLVPCASHAKSVTFPVTGFETVSPDPVAITTDWDESLFGKYLPSVYCHGIARIAAIFSEVAYVDAESGTKDNELTSCYEQLGFKNSGVDYHYDVNYNDPVWGNDQTAFSIACKDIDSALGKRTLIFVIIRGTPLNANEWCSNANLNNTTQTASINHEGFFRAAEQVRKSLDLFIKIHGIEAKSSFFLITGHSRGASVANVLGSCLVDDDNFDSAKIYTYTFASPNVTTDEHAGDSRYDGIWNIVNAEDIVPAVPFTSKNWQYRKYGKTRVLVNSWNCDPDTYEKVYLPAMNVMYRQFLHRDYSPFKTGPFIPVQLSRILRTINKDVDSFYTGSFALHGRAEKIFHRVFPDPVPPSVPEETKHGNSSLFGTIKTKVDDYTDGLAQYSLDAFVDMHSMEGYLSWLLTLNEDEVFSTVKSMQLVIKGNFSGAVIDSNKSVIAQIFDGQILLSSLRRPVAGWQLLPNRCVIGIPGNEDFSVIIYKDSILPTPLSLFSEVYNSDGTLDRTCPQKYIAPHKGLAYEFIEGASSVSQKTMTDKQLRGKDARKAIRRGNLTEADPYRVQPEINIDTDGNVEFGLHSGTKVFYMSILGGQNITNIGKALVISPGIGTQYTLCGPILLNSEAYFKFVQSLTTVSDDEDTGKFNLVPSIRLLLTVKPRHRVQFFAGGVFDFHIENLNDTAFASELRPANIKAWHFSDSAEAFPSIQFGLRF